MPSYALARWTSAPLGLALGVVLVLASTPAAAQPRFAADRVAEPDAAARAVALFREAQDAESQERWSEAAELYRRAYALGPSAPALLNLASSLAAASRLADAAVALDQLLAVHTDAPADLIALAERRRAALLQGVASLSLVGLPAGPGAASLVVDSLTVPDQGERPLVLRLDAGAHSLSVSGAAGEPFHWRGALSAGDSREVAVLLDLDPARVASASSPASGSADEAPDIASTADAPQAGVALEDDPAFWVLLVGGVAFLVAGAVVIGLVAAPQDDPRLEPRSPVVFEL